MQHLFLTSAIGTPQVAASIRTHLNHNKPLITAFITTPIEPPGEQEDLSWYETDRHALRASGFDYFDYTITDKKPTDFTHDLASVDALYVSGGNTPYLLKQSQKSGFTHFVQEFVRSGKLYLGTSCGSIIAGPELPAYLWGEDEEANKLTDYTSYNLVKFTLLPHWGSQVFRDLYLGGRMEQIYAENLQSFVACNDYQYVEVIGEDYHLIDVRHAS